MRSALAEREALLQKLTEKLRGKGRELISRSLCFLLFNQTLGFKSPRLFVFRAR